MSRRRRIRTVIVDDSAVARQLLHRVLTDAGDFEIIDAVADGERAVDRVGSLRPDLVTMDLHLPGIDGLEVTRRIMRRSPTAIAIVAASTSIDHSTIFEALEAGALTAVQRPVSPGQPDYLRRRRQLLAELRSVAHASFPDSRVPATKEGRTVSRPAAPSKTDGAAAPSRSPRLAPRPIDIIAIAASTGGPQALRRLLSGLPSVGLPPIVVVQHITEGFVAGLAEWLDSATPGAVRIAVDGERLVSGVTLLAPDDLHLTVTREGRVRLRTSPAAGSHRPSATVMFDSIAAAFGARALGIVLTGMGRDGAAGLLRIRQAGGLTIAEDPATAVVGGMPGASIALGAAGHVLPLEAIGPSLLTVLPRPSAAPLAPPVTRRSMS